MAIHTAKLTEKTQGHCDIIDITAKVRHELERQKIRRGLATREIVVQLMGENE